MTGLTRYQRLAFRLMGQQVSKTARSNVHLRMSLQKAHIYLRPEVYLGYSYLNMILAFAGSLVLVIGLALVNAIGLIVLPWALFALLIPVPLVLAFVIYLLTFLVPDMRASSRARDIEARLPYALNYMATMASAGITPDKIFYSLSQQSVYGEVANEAALIHRDLNLMGRDLVTALTAAIDRSPSMKFQDLMQGAITAISSGGDLKHYFRSKNEQFFYENRQDQQKFLESLGVLAESYVTVVVAGPVFMLVLLSVMLMFGGSGTNMLTMGYLLVLVLVPGAQLAFGLTIDFLTPEA